MPAGIPVGTLAIGKAGAVNAALLAAAILALVRSGRGRRARCLARGADRGRGGEPEQRCRMSAEVAQIGQSFAPGATIGILGGGQLGRMTVAGGGPARLSLPHLLPGEGLAGQPRRAAPTSRAYDDPAALARFAAAVDVVTFEFENVPDRTAALLAAAAADPAGAPRAASLPGAAAREGLPRLDRRRHHRLPRGDRGGRAARRDGGPGLARDPEIGAVRL
jgi:hypothetical protein